jgi:hypothetical protein
MTPRFLVLLLGLLHGVRSSDRAPRTAHARSLPSLITREHVERRRAESRSLVSRGKPTGGGKYPFLAVVDWTDFDHGVLDPRVRRTARAANLDDCCFRPRLTFFRLYLESTEISEYLVQRCDDCARHSVDNWILQTLYVAFSNWSLLWHIDPDLALTPNLVSALHS